MKKVLFLNLMLGAIFFITIFVSAEGEFYTRTPAGTSIVSPVSAVLNSSSPLDFQCGDPVIGIGFWAVGNNSFTPSYETPVQSWAPHLEFIIDLPPGDYSEIKIMCGPFGGGHGVGRALEGSGWGTGFVFTVNSLSPVSITTTSLPGAIFGAPYSQTLQVSGGTLPHTWSIIGGGLPSGLSLNSSTGEIFGIPNFYPTSQLFTVLVVDGNNQTTSKNLDISIGGAEYIYSRTPNGTSIPNSMTITLDSTYSSFDFGCNPSGGNPWSGIGFWAVGNNSFTPSYETSVQSWAPHLEFVVDLPPGDYSQVKIMCGPFGGGHGVGRALEGGDGWGNGYVFTVGNTPSGTNVSISENGVDLIFSSVTQSGQTTITTSSGGQPPPTGFKIGNPATYYSISTTALFTGTAEVCISWTQGQFNNENNLKLFHNDGTNWVNITEAGYPDTANNIICGLATSFSDFAIFEKKQVEAVIDIKPGASPNAINLGSNGTVPVAIFSTPEFDATMINPLSVSLASAPVKLKGNGTAMYSFQDMNNDGLLDLIVHVNTEALQLSSTDELANFVGYAADNTEVIGSDTVRVVQ